MNKRNWIILAAAVVAAVVVALLVWRPFGGGSEAAAVAAAPERPATTVRVAEAKVGDVASWVFADGTARATEREYLTFEDAGKVVYVMPGPDGGELREGQRVEQGQVLARQDQRQSDAAVESAQASVNEATTGLAVAESQLRQARTQAELEQTTFRRYQRLRERESASDQEYEQAEVAAKNAEAAVERAQSQVEAARAQVASAETRLRQARVDLEETELVAPIDGVVAYKNIEAGQYFSPTRVQTSTETAALSSIPMVLIDPSAFEITVSVPSYERGRIQPGQVAMIGVGSDAMQAIMGDSAAIEGEVFSVNPAVDPGGRAIQVKVRTTRPTDRLEDGMFVTVWIQAEQETDVIVAPLDAVLYQDNQPAVFVVSGEPTVATRREVELGLQGFEGQVITAGVEAGERLVTDGRFQISDGTPVQVLDDAEAGQ